MTVTLRVRSIVWFLTGAGVAVLVMLVLLSSMSADAAPGDEDSTLVPITPCRLVDSRDPSQPAIGPGQTQTYDAHGTNGPVVGSQCTIPSDAVGLSMNVTALNATAETFWTIWPAGEQRPEASSLNPAPGQPPTPNAVNTPLSPSGQFSVFNAQGTAGILVDVNGYYTDSSLMELHQRVRDLEVLTASMSTTVVEDKPVLRFTGVNVQVVDGTGDTHCNFSGFEACNGVGNLIVGYSEDPDLNPNLRSGSHNLVVGIDHSWSSSAGVVAGQRNTITGLYATVTGGANNRATALGSTVSGGAANRADGIQSSVVGGSSSEADGESSVVVGGRDNLANGEEATVVGGIDNLASGPYSSVLGGTDNLASGSAATVSGGDTNWATGPQASVAGGLGNLASGTRTAIAGGEACLSAITDGALVGDTFPNGCIQLN